MAAKVKSKGTALLMEIAAVYTAVTGLKSVSVTGVQSETWEYKVLDGAAAIASVASTDGAIVTAIYFT